jgi:flagellar basal-body rod modification protein FlgD
MDVAAIGTQSVSNTSSTDGSSGTKSTSGTADLGQDAFLQLLITQLQYQDPLSPMDNTAFVAQLAQFTTLSEIQKLNTTANELLTSQGLASAACLIGTNVSGLDEDGGAVSGIAEAALMKDSKIYVRIGDADVALSTVTEVTAGSSDE